MNSPPSPTPVVSSPPVIDGARGRALIGLALALHAMSLLGWYEIMGNITFIGTMKKSGLAVVGTVTLVPAGVGNPGSSWVHELRVGSHPIALPSAPLSSMASGSLVELLQSREDPDRVLIGRTDASLPDMYQKNFGNLVLSIIRAVGAFLIGGWCFAASLHPTALRRVLDRRRNQG